jgi:WD40 repeat protein
MPIGRCGESCAGLAFLPGDSHFALSGDGVGLICLWNLDEGIGVWADPPKHDKKSVPGLLANVNCLAFSEDGGTLASVNFGGKLVVWDVSRDEPELRLTPRYPLIDYHEQLWRVAISDDGSVIAIGSAGGRVRVCDARSGRLLHEFRAQEGDVNGVAFLDGQTVVSTGDGAHDPKAQLTNSALMVWDTGPGDDPSFGGRICSLAVDDHARVRITTEAGSAERFIGFDGRLHNQRTTSGPAATPWSPPAAGPDERTPNWGMALRSTRAPDPNAVKEGVAGQHPTPGPALPGGKACLYVNAVGMLQLWGVPETATGQPGGGRIPMRFLRGHQGIVTAAAVSPNGRYVVSGDEHGIVKVWDLFRPLHCHDLELRLSEAQERLVSRPDDPNALTALAEWYAFRGRPLPTKAGEQEKSATAN